jgi:hypothetical protein
MALRDYSKALDSAQQQGVDFEIDYHAQSIGGLLAELARSYGYRKPKNANGSTGRYFFQRLQREYRRPTQ